MSESSSSRRRRSRSSRRKGSARPFWGNPDIAAGPEHYIEPVDHPTALIESLGAPPFPRADAAPHYFTAVYTRATGMALALAHAYGIVDDEDEDEGDGDVDDPSAD